jgi:predicted RNA-binding protein with PIN domain
MPPTLIIDGYNLIRNSSILAQIDRQDIEEGREALISRLAEYRKIRRFPITVVFDGAGSYHLASQGETRLGIKILYSSKGKTADEVIVSLAGQKGREVVVVTSDHGICDRLKRSDCICVSSEVFDAKIDSAFYELYKGMSMEEEDLDRGGSKKGASKRLPKKLRKQRDILSKL